MCDHTCTIFTQGERCCTDCGLMLGETQYVTSYNRHCTYRRNQPVYSRQKRFYQFLIASENQAIYNNLEDLMTIFGELEFFWGIKRPKNRIYFFNRFVTLVFLMQQLGLDTTGMRTLKDKERVCDQIKIMGEILKNSLL